MDQFVRYKKRLFLATLSYKLHGVADTLKDGKVANDLGNFTAESTCYECGNSSGAFVTPLKKKKKLSKIPDQKNLSNGGLIFESGGHVNNLPNGFEFVLSECLLLPTFSFFFSIRHYDPTEHD